jgi:hypothetical protein
MRRVHPYTFSVVLASTTILALTENDVMNSQIISFCLVMSHVASLLYLQVGLAFMTPCAFAWVLIVSSCR